MRKAEDWEKVGVLYKEHERERLGDDSPTRTMIVAQTETRTGTGIDLGS